MSNNINTTINTLGKDYSSIRIETYKTGEGKRRYSYSPENEQKARDFANSHYTNGYKVTWYVLDGYKAPTEEAGNTIKEELEAMKTYKSVNVSSEKQGEGYIVWAHSLETTADGREQKPKVTAKTETKVKVEAKVETKTKKTTKKKESKVQEVAQVAAPVAAPAGACEEQLSKRIDILEKQIADLTLAVSTIVTMLNNSKN